MDELLNQYYYPIATYPALPVGELLYDLLPQQHTLRILSLGHTLKLIETA